MNRFTVCIILIFITFSFLRSQSEDLSTHIETIQQQVNTVEAGSDTYEQKLESDTETPYNIIVGITKTDKKGKVKQSEYHFNLADLDPFLIKRDRGSKKVMAVELKTKRQLKTIKVYEDGEQKNYANKFTMYGVDFDNAKSFMDAVKAAIPAAEKLDDRNLDFPSLADSVSWLTEQISNVQIGEESTDQNLKQLEDASPRFIFTSIITTSKGAKKETYQFNFADLNKAAVTFKVKGKNLLVELSTKRKRKLIEHYKEGEKQNYSNKFELLLKDVNTARDVTKIFQGLIPKFEDIQADALPEITNLEEGLNLLTENISLVSTGSHTYNQKMDASCVNEFLHEKVEDKSGKKESSTYRFNLADINTKSINIKVSGKDIWLELPIKEKKKLIQYTKNSELQNYTNSLKLIAKDVENVRLLEHLFPQVAELCGKALASSSANEPDNYTDWIIEQVTKVQSENKETDQYLEKTENDCLLRFKRITSAKKSLEEIYEFGLKEFDPEKIDFSVSGKELFVKLGTRYKESVIKYYKDGESGKYQKELKIMVEDVEKARKMIDAFKGAIEGCQN